MSRTASCSCGQLTIACEGEPIRVSICYCLECQKRTGSIGGVQARFAIDKVAISGRSSEWSRTGDSGSTATFHFCPTCSAIVYWAFKEVPDAVSVPVGNFADPSFPPPQFSVYNGRRAAWADMPNLHTESWD
jgi:hypothetical protein